jgi:hypothetical protein
MGGEWGERDWEEETGIYLAKRAKIAKEIQEI